MHQRAYRGTVSDGRVKDRAKKWVKEEDAEMKRETRRKRYEGIQRRKGR